MQLISAGVVWCPSLIFNHILAYFPQFFYEEQNIWFSCRSPEPEKFREIVIIVSPEAYFRNFTVFCRQNGNFSSHTLILKHIFTNHRRQEECTSYSASFPALILLVPNKFTNRWLCQYLRIAAIIVLDGQSPAKAWQVIWSAPLGMQSEELRSSIFNNWQRFAKEIKACCFVIDCLLRMELHVSRLNSFQRFHHNSLNTRNNGKVTKLPKVKLDFARSSFYFLGASIHCH